MIGGIINLMVIKMEGNTANDIIVDTIEEEENTTTQPNTLQDTIKELAKNLHEKNVERMSNLTSDNIDGMTQADVLNEYMDINFGYRYKTLDKLIKSKTNRVVSRDGFGIAAFIETIKSIQASFEQHQIPDNLKGIFKR